VWAFPVAAVVGYVLGSVPSGLIMGRLSRGIDIRDYGSGKTGFTNALRTLGWKAALPVFLADLAKGALPVVMARLMADEPYVQTVAGLAAVVGHDWPLFAGFRGGRGVAAAFGALLGMAPWVALALMPIGLGIALVSRYMSLMSISGGALTAAVLAALAVAGVEPWAYAVYGLLAGGLVVVLHRENIRRLLAGTEPRVGRGGQSRVEEVGRAS